MNKEQFLKNVHQHEMAIMQNDGVFRHIKYSKPGLIDYSFALTTWPGHLCISGDMGCYVFRRLYDMFDFFRSSSMKINPDYWHEKLVSDSRFESSQKFSEEIFEEIITRIFREACLCGDIKLKNRREVWQEIKNSVLCAENEQDAHKWADDFECCGFEFTDFWEYDLTDFTNRFLWCLYAIAWGINEYDNRKDI